MRTQLPFHQFFLSLLLLVIFVTGCAQPAAPILPSPTASQTPTHTMVPTNTASPTETMVPTETLIPTPAFTPVPPALILAEFPLAVGARWVYAAEIEYWDSNAKDYVSTWTGTITDTVIAKNETPDGKIVITLQEDMDPPPSELIWRAPGGSFEYTIAEDGVFEGSSKIYQWPLTDGARWELVPGFAYQRFASSLDAVSTPYGQLKGCYLIFVATNPDSSSDTFCPKIGFVEHTYRHHGTTQNEHFVLVSFTPGAD